MPFLPLDKERFDSETSHVEKANSFFKESPFISGASVVLIRLTTSLEFMFQPLFLYSYISILLLVKLELLESLMIGIVGNVVLLAGN
ncbi:hypothetical protein GCM10008025_08540 [Ornithinibacillus halotolerans]|uniref:Uncharacterized protein n=1 Tax=Ornithinibacillus halotolerans TaxID=1274357 RepID=A0A916W4I0_9BACI|nr:hypothetical protein GCM10008025_08540 [Ornithinibacillus halotolerans]